MTASAAFRRALEDGDVKHLRGMWAQLASHLPQPESEEAAEIVMHRARTESATVGFKFRAYSHRWLSERGLPSGLPDELKPRAERVEPIQVIGVAISYNFRTPHLKPAAEEVRRSMEHAVLDAQAQGRLADAPFVKARMGEARDRTLKALFGQVGGGR